MERNRLSLEDDFSDGEKCSEDDGSEDVALSLWECILPEDKLEANRKILGGVRLFESPSAPGPP